MSGIARKDYICTRCKKPIFKGTYYVSVGTVGYNYEHYHLLCAKAENLVLNNHELKLISKED